MEINSRIQVEHPITEMVTGVDIVEQQLKIASGVGLDIRQEDVNFSGHALECRINAEHPTTFAPFPGVVEKFIPPSGESVRVDTALYAGYSIPPFYDSLIAKVICHAENRDRAIEKMRKALTYTRITGIPTTIPFHISALHDERFIQGDYNTSFVNDLKPFSSKEGEVAAAIFSALPKKRRAPRVAPQIRGRTHQNDPWLQSRFEEIVSRADRISQNWTGNI